MDGNMSVGIFFNNVSSTTGPGKVALNLLKGFKKSGIDFKINEEGKLNGCLQLVSYLNILPSTTLIGPNIMVLPSEFPVIWKKFENHIVPSEWVKNKYNSFPETEGCNLHIWPVGIDTDKFKKFDNKNEFDCLIYYKNRGAKKLKEVEDKLKSLELSYKIIGYGSYTEEEFLELLSKCKFCLLLTKTESQGIAYMEILSTNTPCYVYDKQEWDDISPYSFAATSAPYFSEECGLISSDLRELENFIDNVNYYEPRQYILENHTVEKGAAKYLELLGGENA